MGKGKDREQVFTPMQRGVLQVKKGGKRGFWGTGGIKRRKGPRTQESSR